MGEESMLARNEKGPIRRIGLTGGVGSGKSTVARMLSERGIPVIDTDAVAHELLSRPGGEAVIEITARFGNEAVAADGTIDRPAMARRVFADDALRTALESILHPAINRVVEERIEELSRTADTVVIEVPLLYEAGWDRFVDAVVVVDCSPEQQVARFVERTGATEVEARRRMSSQMTRAARNQRADFVLPNVGSLSELKEAVELLLPKLRKVGGDNGC
jgi:dephospho-CoA kinase